MDCSFSQLDLTLVSNLYPNQSSIKSFYNDSMKKEKLSQRIRRLRIKLGYSQEQLAKAVGVSDVTISKWEGGRDPNSKHIPLLAKALRCSEIELLHGAVNVEPGPDISGFVPLISWVTAGAWLEMEVREYAEHSLQPTTAKVGPRAFALRVTGDSMTAMAGKSIPDGSTVIVDPDIVPEHGKIVIARLDDSALATMKQLIIDGGQKFLKPLNPAYPLIPINGNCSIIGVVKQVYQDF